MWISIPGLRVRVEDLDTGDLSCMEAMVQGWTEGLIKELRERGFYREEVSE